MGEHKHNNHWDKASYAIFAALLFGATAPFVKILSGMVQAQLLAGILYLGFGIGLGAWFLLQNLFARLFGTPKSTEANLKRSDLPWLLSAIFAGGVIAPVLLVFGLLHTTGAAGSLTLNFETVFTALLAWFVFKENFDQRIAIGMLLIFAGGVCLTWSGPVQAGSNFASFAVPANILSGSALTGNALGITLTAAACFFWALDNNFTRKISDANPVQIACVKGTIAGIVNTVLAFYFGAKLVSLQTAVFAAIVGLLGYGLSLVLYVISLRSLGTSRSSAYFAAAPFIGALLSIVILHDSINFGLIAAAVVMGLGIWLHLTEDHQHDHIHEAIEHEHSHVHDVHHIHTHGDGEPDGEPHSHWHKHDELAHSHHHFPDTHHRHAH